MKRKKLLSTAVAGMLVAAQMAMPVMAADGGSFDVDVTTKTGILRVEVPTTLAIAVDQFETTNSGTQIYSEEFTIANKSEVNVKVSVTSTATAKDGVEFAATKSSVSTATATGGTAWLAVAAKKSATNYEAASGSDNFANLSDASANVTTFAKKASAVVAEQTFYLQKGTGNASYKLLKPSADGKDNNKSYGQFYKLTALGTQPTTDAELQTAVNASDVYVVVTNNAGNDGETVTKIAKGTTVASSTYVNTNTYYTAALVATAKADLKAADIYVYGELTKAASGADAAFRYIGALSPNKEVWDATDISKINIAYTIQGLKQSDYDAAAAASGRITYGLYKAPSKLSAQTVSTTAPTLTVASGYTIQSVSVTRTNGTSQTFTENANYTLSTSNNIQSITFAEGTLTYADNAGAIVTITFSDNSTETIRFS